ncbi:MAG: hypothetical protein KDK69_03755 [Chlamydiia bacterium]|nr:hypothetical protein [Chlamydiia bacterium]
MDAFEDIVSSITKKTGQQIEKQDQNLEFVGIGGSMSSEGVINFETLSFNVKRKLSRDEGIALISKIVEVYKRNIYSEKKMALYLEKHSFNFKDLQINLFVFDCNGDEVLHPDFKFISLHKGFFRFTRINEKE